MANEYDVIIVGGGIVGASLAMLLANLSMRIAIIESTPLGEKQPSSKTDRTIVLSESSRIILESLKIWSNLAENACCINQIHVSDQGHFGSSHILAEDEKLPALGYVLSAKAISNALFSAIKPCPIIHILQPAKFRSFTYQGTHVLVEVEKDHKTISLKGKLLVAADGQYSAVRKYLNIPIKITDYQQAAILCQIDLKRPHNNVAHERFTHQGPLALLPLLGQQAAVVWTVSKDHSEQLLALSIPDFLANLQQNLGYRLGKIVNCSKPFRVDLQLITARQQIASGVVLIGNAVHTLHPVAGQGLNLALRDVAVLAEEIHYAISKGKEISDMETFRNYLARRKLDQEQTIRLTHSLIGVFSNSLLPVVLARNMGMILLDRVQSLKKILTKRALGFAGRVPRLACGLPLE